MAKAQENAAETVRAFALGLPEAWEDNPWGERVAKVGKKVFVFFGIVPGAGGFGLSVKLTVSGPEALRLPFVQRTGYGLGQHGWVTATFAEGEAIPADLLCCWIEESYRAVAPKKLLAKLDSGPSAMPPLDPPPKPRRRSAKGTQSRRSR